MLHLFSSNRCFLRSFCSASILCGVVSGFAVSLLSAQDSAEPARFTLDTTFVEAESVPLIQDPFLPDVRGVQIYSGKKSSVIDLDALPRITNNNYRQALSTTPGLYLSEETSPLVSIGYRGLDPHRVQFTQVLKDGIPIHADQFGYPEAYFTPPLDTVDRIEFLRGGAALLYGPQPGGALNYVTHRPRTDKSFAGSSSHTIGSNSYYSTFTHLEGTSGRVGWYGYFNHRQGEGYRTANSDFDLIAGHIKLVLDGTTDSRWILSLDAYEEDHGEPGGLTFEKGPLAVNYNENRDRASRLYDHFELQRYSASLQWEKDFSEDTQMVTSLWGTYYSRYSARQRGGGFGTLPAGPDAETTSVEQQLFYTGGIESRIRHNYSLLGGDHTLTGGVQFYHTTSPREDRRGDNEHAEGGRLRNDSDREVNYLPVFIENRFAWGRFSITPGVRIENIWQSVKENKNVDKTAAGVDLADNEDGETVPLFGLGLEWEVMDKVELYGSVAQSYRPKTYSQAVPTEGTSLIPTDLEESMAVQYEIGFRGQPRAWINWDTSLFLLEFDDQIGKIALPGGFSTLQNVGNARHYGAEMALNVDVIGLAGAIFDEAPTTGKDGKSVAAPTWTERFGSLNLYGNVMLLNAEFTSGPLEGLTPRFAPDYLVRTGIIYRSPKDRLSIAFTGTIVGEAFADDANTAQRFVPAYMVWDLTAEVKVYKDTVSLTAGINNVFDEDYYSRIRDDGIDPGADRNFYVGATVRF